MIISMHRPIKRRTGNSAYTLYEVWSYMNDTLALLNDITLTKR